MEYRFNCFSLSDSRLSKHLNQITDGYYPMEKYYCEYLHHDGLLLYTWWLHIGKYINRLHVTKCTFWSDVFKKNVSGHSSSYGILALLRVASNQCINYAKIEWLFALLFPFMAVWYHLCCGFYGDVMNLAAWDLIIMTFSKHKARTQQTRLVLWGAKT